jgi:hypothetical protein
MSAIKRSRSGDWMSRGIPRALVVAASLVAVWFAPPGLNKPSGSPSPAEGYVQTVPAGSRPPQAESYVPTVTARSGPPPANGYFRTFPIGSWSKLPGDARCARYVHRSTWEPRPSNAIPNRTMPAVAAVRRSLAARPVRAQPGSYDRRWDTWLLARVTGHHTGTTDENIQWAACKWGLSDNLVRAVADAESTWFQRERFRSGACVEKRGCGDIVVKGTPATGVYCNQLKRYGYDYQKDYGARRCPKTFSIIGVMSWEDPAWGRMAGNQNGTFPFSRDSTAFALDYYGAFMRGCLEGWAWWLTGSPGTARSRNVVGRLNGCVGAWYAGAWKTKPANDYTALVNKTWAQRVWLDRGWK